MGALTLQKQVQAASAQQARMLKTISDHDHAVAFHQQTFQLVHTLRKQVMEQEKRLKDVQKAVASEHADHKKFRDSHVRRLAYRVGGKTEQFEERASKEEQEWLDAVQAELNAKRDLERVQEELTEAEKTKNELFTAASRRNAAEAELDELYNRLFEGPTPDCPEEDVQELEVHDAQRDYDIVQMTVSAEEQTIAVLQQAEDYLTKALSDINTVLNSKQMNMPGVDTTWPQMQERRLLERAQGEVQEVHRLLKEAQSIQPDVGGIAYLEAAEMDFLSNIVCPNIFSNQSLRDRILVSQKRLRMAQELLRDRTMASRERLRHGSKEMSMAKKKLQTKRMELRQLRTTLFERLAKGMNDPDDLPPTYELGPPVYTT